MNAQLTLALLPDFVVGVGALLLLLWSAGRRDDDVAASRTAALIAVGVCVTALVAVGALAARGTADLVRAGAPVAADQFRWAADAVILVGTAFAALLAGDFGRRERPVSGEALALMLLSASGMMLLAGARDLVLVFLGVELTSIPVYVLAGLNRRSARSAEAALKYFLLGAFSSAFLLYGIALVYGATGSTNLALIGAALTADGPLPRLVFSLGVGFTLVGFAFKVAAAPFHMWTPDVYEGAPTPVTAFMAAAVKTGAFAAFARVFLEAFAPVAAGRQVHQVLWWLAVVTMVGGNVVALAQRNVKRMLAYSSIAHAGYLLVALVSNSGRGASAIVFYLFAYTLATVGAFAVVEAVGGSSTGAQDMDRWSGLFSARPRLAVAMAVFMLALLGFPLAGGMGFFAKAYVLQAALAARQNYLSVWLVLASVVSAGYYLYLVAVMFMRRRPADAPELPPTPAWTGGVIAACAVVLLLLGLYPTPAVRWSRAAELTPAGSPSVPAYGTSASTALAPGGR